MSKETICFIPCCNAKFPSGCKDRYLAPWYEDMDITRAKLLKGRETMKPSINGLSPLTDALTLYTGNFYRPLEKKCIAEKISNGDLRIFVISAGYGVVESFEPIYNYDAKMDGAVARVWKDAGLVDIISAIILKYSPEKVFGFFAGEAEWSGSASKYRYFYSEGVKRALSQGLKVAESGCFYRAEGRGTAPILSLLGMCFMDAVSSNFSNDFVNIANEKGFRDEHYSTALVKYERFSTVKNDIIIL